MYTGPVGRLSTCPASSFLMTSPRGSAAGLGAGGAVLPHATSAAASAAAAAGNLSPLMRMMALESTVCRDCCPLCPSSRGSGEQLAGGRIGEPPFPTAARPAQLTDEK